MLTRGKHPDHVIASRTNTPVTPAPSWHEFTASNLHYLKEDRLTSKGNRECFTLDIVLKTRLGVSTEIRDREGILKSSLCLFPFVLYF